ncbi:MAG: hypothetical protein WDA08_00315 [Weeksellaceae bacterium]
MKTKLFLAFIFFFSLLNAQEKIEIIKNGVLTMKNDEKIEFSNLYYDGDKVHFININTQQQEHLFLSSILSIDKGETEYLNKKEFKKSAETNILKDGLYRTPENLKAGLSQPGNYQLVVKNDKKGYYYVVDSNGKKVKNAFAYSENGILYLRGGGIKPYQANSKALIFRRNNRMFLKMNFQNGQYVGKGPFINDVVSTTGAILIGVGAGVLAPTILSAATYGAAGAAVYYLIVSQQKEINFDLQNEKITLY